MNWAWNTGRTPIGLDVGARHVKAAQLIRTRAGWTLAAAACIERTAPPGAAPAPEELRHWQTVLAQQGFRGRGIVLTAPEGLALSGVLQLPPRSSGAPLEQLARGELARMHRCEAARLEMCCWDLPSPARSANTTFVMAVGCLHDRADALLDAYEEQGFDVRTLTLPALALARACRGLAGDNAASLVDLGWSASRIVLLQDRAVVYERVLPDLGVGRLVERLAEVNGSTNATAETLLRQQGVSGDADTPAGRLGGDFLRDLASEVATALSYLASQYANAATARVLLAGGGAHLGGVADGLASATGLDVQAVTATDVATCPGDLDAAGGALLPLAMGLCALEGD